MCRWGGRRGGRGGWDGVVVGTAAELLQRFEEAGRFRVELESCNARSCDGWAVVIEVSRRQAGGALASNETVFGEIEGAGEVDVWTFMGEAGQRVTVGAEALAFFGLDLTLDLRSASGEVVAFDDDSGFARNPLIAGGGAADDGGVHAAGGDVRWDGGGALPVGVTAGGGGGVLGGGARVIGERE